MGQLFYAMGRIMEDYSMILVSLMKNLNIGPYVVGCVKFALPDCVASVPILFISVNWLITASTMY